MIIITRVTEGDNTKNMLTFPFIFYILILAS
nr:MAG TPA: hypothetical protein [Caudoviricetes sp.]